MSAAGLMLAGWAVEAAFGWPDWLYRLIRHPVVWFGFIVRKFDETFNVQTWPHRLRYLSGALVTVFLVSVATVSAFMISCALPNTFAGQAAEATIVSSLIASRSLYQHVAAVTRPLVDHDLPTARTAVSMIVGRDPSQLDEAGIARAALESLAENASDGVTAPLFWGAIFGLPGIVAYKAVNTLDSMIGHRTPQHGAFGGFAARLDDIANLVPARLTGLLFASVSGTFSSVRIMVRDAGSHRSPNAGWPEAAMAGALNVRLSGPRVYGERTCEEPWLNCESPDPRAEDLKRGLALYCRAMFLGACLLGIIAVSIAIP